MTDQGRKQPCSHPHPSDMVGCFTCGQVGPDDTPGLEVVAVLSRGREQSPTCVGCGQPITSGLKRPDRPSAWHAECLAGRKQTVRPRPGDLEAATLPHPFRPSGEFAGASRAEVCDLCGLVQRGVLAMHYPEVPDA